MTAVVVQLRGDQFSTITTLLSAGFESYDQLAEFTKTRVGLRLNNVTSEREGLDVAAFRIVRDAESQGYLALLLAMLAKQFPNSKPLNDLIEDYQINVDDFEPLRAQRFDEITGAAADVSAAIFHMKDVADALRKSRDTNVQTKAARIVELEAASRTSGTAAAAAARECAALQDDVLAVLTGNDVALDRQVAAFRTVVEDIASTLVGAKALAQQRPVDVEAAKAMLAKLAEERRAGPAAVEVQAVARQVRRLTIGALATLSIGGLLAFAFNFGSLQNNMCAMSFGYPGLSDACGSLGLGERPSREERLAWAALPPGKCEPLRSFVSRFPGGAYRSQAADLIAAATRSTSESWQPTERKLPQTVQVSDTAGLSRKAARAAALSEGNKEAKKLCGGFAAGTIFRLRTAVSHPDEWDCPSKDGSATCGFSGSAVCSLEMSVVTETESCGRAP